MPIDSAKYHQPSVHWTRARCCALLIALVVLPAMAFGLQRFDLAIVQSLETGNLPGDIKKTIHLAEAFAHGTGVAAIFACLLSVDRTRRRALLIALAYVATAMLAATIAKMFVVRVRPYALAEFPQLTSSWWPKLDISIWDSRLRSFPSGHSTTAVAMAFALTRVYPRGWWCFAILASLGCLQRIVAAAHFPSDVIAGATIATAIAIMWPFQRRASATVESCKVSTALVDDADQVRSAA